MEMQNLFGAVREHLERGEAVVLCSILASSGSTPRGAGAKMAVFADGSTMGTVGGGAVELHATQEAAEAHKSGRGFSKGFCLRPNDVADIGMICGGDVTVYFQYLTGADLPVVETILRVLEGNADAWLSYVLRDGMVESMGVYEQGAGLLHADQPAPAVLEPLLRSEGVYQKGDPTLYVEPLVQRGQVYVFGGGHVSRELVPALARVGFAVTVFDDRPHLALAESFPEAREVILGDYSRIGDWISITERDYVVIMTPGHQGDFEVLEQTLRTPARYIGCIGSKGKVAKTKERLREAGVPEEGIARMISPIGLDLGGRTPAEIAVSITAQMIACRSGKL